MIKYTLSITLFTALFLQGCGQAEAEWKDISFNEPNKHQTEKLLFGNIINSNFPLEEASLAQIDINNDGQPEYILHTKHTSYCGSNGCSYAFFVKKNQKWVLNLGLIAHSVQIGTKLDSNGYLPLLVNGARIWQWHNGTYTLTQ